MAYGGQHYLDSRHGSPAAAEICVRVGAAEVTVADTGVVHPGILVRQPYEDADIGQYKAVVLARRLNNVHADDRVSQCRSRLAPGTLPRQSPRRRA